MTAATLLALLMGLIQYGPDAIQVAVSAVQLEQAAHAKLAADYAAQQEAFRRQGLWYYDPQGRYHPSVVRTPRPQQKVKRHGRAK